MSRVSFAGAALLVWRGPYVLSIPGAVYHVMNRGLARQSTFCTPTDYETFLQELGETRALWGSRSSPFVL